MTVHRYLTDLTPSSQIAFAASYPFRQVGHSFVYANGQSHHLSAYDTQDFAAARVAHAGSEALLADMIAPHQSAHLYEERHPVIAVGSNGSPDQLKRKYAGTDDIIPTIRAELADHCVVYAAHLTGYGSVPATLHHCPGASVQVFINFLTGHQLDTMHKTETLGRHYAFSALRNLDMRLDNGAVIDAASAYVSITGVIGKDGEACSLAAIPHQRRLVQGMSETEILDYIRTRIAPDLDFETFMLGHITDRDLRLKREEALLDFCLPTQVAGHG